MQLNRRKNKPQGSRLVRGCWCKECSKTCPVHVLGPMLDELQHGEKMFPGISAGEALRMLRVMLTALGIAKAQQYRTHDLRRGHAKDLQLSGGLTWRVHAWRSGWRCVPGAPLWEILAAGEWRSPAFLAYLDLHRSVHAARYWLYTCARAC